MAMTAFELFGVLKLDRSDFDKGLNDAEKSASKLGSGLATMAGIGIKAIGTATAAVTGFGATAVAVGSSFDAAMGGVAATAGKSVDELSAELGEVDTAYGHFSGTLRDFALYMGQNTTFSATEAANALNYMALAGYNTQESMEMLPSVLSMAAAGSMDLAKASDMITDTQSALGLDFIRTGKMVNEFAKAASTGNTSVEQLGEAMLRVGGLGAELNGGFITLADGTQAEVDNVQELEIAFTAMANAGIKGSEAGTHMRNMLLKLASPTDDGAAAFEALGVSIFDDEGKMRSLGAIMEDLGTGLNSLTQADKLQAISDIFNTRDTAAAEALMNAMGQDWDRIGEAILQADGAADEMSKTKLANLTGDITLFKSALETAQITINDQLSPTLRNFVQLGTKGLQDITTAFNEDGLEGAMEAFGSVLSDGLNMVIKLLPTAISAGAQLLSALGQGIIDNLPQIVDASVQIMVQLAQGLVTAVPELAKGVVTVIQSLKESFEKNKTELADVGTQLLDLLVQGLTEGIPQMLTFMSGLFLEMVNYVSEHADEMAITSAEIIKAIVDGFTTNLPAILEGVAILIISIAEALTNPSTLTPLLEGAVNIILALANGLIQALPALIEAIPVIIQNLVTAIVNNLPMLVTAAVELLGALAQAIIENLPLLIAAAIQIIFALINGLIEALPSLVTAVMSILSEIVRTIIASLPAFIENGIKIVGALIQGIVNMLGSIVKAAIGIIDEFIKGLTQGWAKIIRAGMDIVVKVKEGFNQKIQDAKNWGRDLINNFIEGIKSRAQALWDTVSGIADGIKGLLGFSEPEIGPLSDFHTYAPDMMKLFAQGIQDNEDIVTDQIAKSFNFSDIITNAPTAVVPKPSIFTVSMQNDIIRLLEEIADKDATVVIEGDMDRVFRVMQSKSRTNKQITGQPSFA